VWAGSDDVAPAEVMGLVRARDAARTARDWPRADALRAELADLGWDVVDGPAGSTVRRAT